MSGSPPLFILIVITQQNEAHPHSRLSSVKLKRVPMNILAPQFRRAPEPPLRHLDTQRRSPLLRVTLQTDEPGIVEIPEMKSPLIAIHVGRPVRLSCRRGRQSHEGLAVHGDIDIVPAGITARWEMKSRDTALLLNLSPALLRQTAESCAIDPDDLEIRNRFQIRDPQIEHIGWALKAEAEAGFPNGRLYLDTLATALAMQLLRNHSSTAAGPALFNGRRGMSPRMVKEVLGYIEDHLGDELSLNSIAALAGLSASHFKVVFRQAVGMPLHQYVIRRRVERAASLLGDDRMAISQVALETGFAHQSHLALHMQRILGISPSELRRRRG